MASTIGAATASPVEMMPTTLGRSRDVDGSRLAKHPRHHAQHRRLQLRGRPQDLGERLGGDPPHHAVPQRLHAGRARFTGNQAQLSDGITAGHFPNHLSVGATAANRPESIT